MRTDIHVPLTPAAKSVALRPAPARMGSTNAFAHLASDDSDSDAKVSEEVEQAGASNPSPKVFVCQESIFEIQIRSRIEWNVAKDC